MPSLDMKKFLNKTIAVKTAVGVAASVTAMTAVNAAMPQPQAQDVVQHHAKEINDRSNTAAKILEIDRSSLVQKNYLKAAQRIDDFLTGQTKELHLDSTMFNVDGSLEDASSFGIDSKANEAFNRLSQNLSDMITDQKAEDQSEDFDISKALKERVESDQNANQLLDQVKGRQSNTVDVRKQDEKISTEIVDKKTNVQKNVENVNNANQPNNEIVKPKTNLKPSEILTATETDYKTENAADNKQLDSKQSDVDKSENKSDSKPDEAKKSRSDREKVKDLNVAAAIENYERSNESKKDVESSKSQPSKDLTNETANNQPKDQMIDQDPAVDETEPSKESKNLADENKSESSRPIESREENKDSKVIAEENLTGVAEISIHVRYNNNKKITDFKIIKNTSGVRRADGSEVWESVTFDRSDLPSEFLSDPIWDKATLLNPEFSSSYVPTSSDFKVSDTLTMRAKSRAEMKADSETRKKREVETSKETHKDESTDVSNKESKKSSRTINLRTPNGEILKTIVQPEGESEYKIPQTIDDWFVTDTSVIYSDEDKDIVYQARYETVEDSINYQITDYLDGRESTQKSTQIKAIKKIDKLENKTIESNEESEANKITTSIETAYHDVELESTEVNVSDKTIIRKYRSIENVEAVKPASREDVNSATDKMLASMPTVSNRAEYSRYTSINDQFANLLERSSIEKCVFELSTGSYSYQQSDKQLKPSRETVALLELNRRVTDRLIERINEYRRQLGLNEVTIQSLTMEQERMFASHAVYNYLANNHSSSKINDSMMKMLNLQRLETMQPVHKIKVADQMLTPEAIADSLFRTILNETYSYVVQDGGETGHLEQLLDPDVKTVYAGTFIGSYEQVEKTAKMFGKSLTVGQSNDYTLSTTLQYFK